MKKWMFITIAMLLAIGIAVLFFVFGRDNNTEQKQETDPPSDILTAKDNWLTVDTVPKLEELAKKYNITIDFDSEYAYISQMPFADGEASYNYRFTSEGNIVELSIGYVLVDSTESGDANVMENIDEQEFQNRINTVNDWIEEFLEVKIDNKFYIFSYDGSILPLDDVASYRKILDGTAYMELRILDADGSVWVLNIEMLKGYNIVFCTFDHCSADSDEAKILCYVAIE